MTTPAVNTQPSVSEYMNLVWKIEGTIAHLHASLVVGSSDEFTDFSTEIQNAFLYGCVQLAESIKSDFQAMCEAHRQEFKRGVQP